jgi:hypothetical protein
MAAALLAAGCDYWNNLVDDKALTRAPLRIKVTDALTNWNMYPTKCKDPDRGLDIPTDEAGEIFLPNAGTGPYSITCYTPWGYYEKNVKFDLTSAGANLFIKMARMGGKENWYKDDTLRQVRIRNQFDTIRFPSIFQMSAYPEDPEHKLLHFIWKFSKATHLDRDEFSSIANTNIYDMNSGTNDADIGPDTLTLTVLSLLNGTSKDEIYEVGTYKRAFTWVRNLLPKFEITLLSKTDSVGVGCPDSQPLSIGFEAFDPDGECKSVTFSTRKATTSSLGKIDTVFDCDYKKIVVFPMKNTFNALSHDYSFGLGNTLYISVMDDNFKTFDTSIQISTKTNILPNVTASIVGLPAVVFLNEEVKVKYQVADSNHPVREVLTRWGDGENFHGQTRIDYASQEELTHIVNDTISHYYTEQSPPEGYTVQVTATDPCLDTSHVKAGKLIVLKNSDPKAVLSSGHREISGDGNLIQSFRLSLSDSNVFDGLDRYTRILVDWKDGTPTTDSTKRGEPYSVDISHKYTAPPGPSGKYELFIQVNDAHKGVFTLDTTFAPPP